MLLYCFLSNYQPFEHFESHSEQNRVKHLYIKNFSMVLQIQFGHDIFIFGAAITVINLLNIKHEISKLIVDSKPILTFTALSLFLKYLEHHPHCGSNVTIATALALIILSSLTSLSLRLSSHYFFLFFERLMFTWLLFFSKVIDSHFIFGDFNEGIKSFSMGLFLTRVEFLLKGLLV